MLVGSTASGRSMSSDLGACWPKENNEWLFEDEAESVGFPTVEGRLGFGC